MFNNPNPQRAADKAIARSPGCLDPGRIYSTPQEEIDLALAHRPRTQDSTNWIDPRLSCVYVIANEANDLCKLGHANDLRSRFSSMQTGSPVQLHIAHFIFVAGPPVAKWVEAFAHQLLKQHRIKGEWFRVDVETAAQAIAMPIIQRNLRWWSEEDRRKLGKEAAKVHCRDLRRAA